VPIDPVELKLSEATYETVQLNGVFGALRDAGPDFWGRRVIEKHAGKPQLGEMDYLLESPDDRAGALGFGLNKVPPSPLRKFNQTIDLERLQELAEALVKDEIPADPAAAQVQELLLLGTSMGGACPKAVVQDDDGLWMAKFNRPDDGWNNTRVNTLCCGWRGNAASARRKAGSKQLEVKTFSLSNVSTGKKPTRATRVRA
jgi:serine/threonine-protein kinase HipA